jgi:predicted aconitase
VGESKVIDQEFVRSLGKGIQRSADESLPRASQLAKQAADSMQAAGQSGGIAVAAAFFFACEYTANAWARKQDDAETVNDAAQRIADNWQATEEHYGKAPTRAME